MTNTTTLYRWVKASERLPEKNKNVFVKTGSWEDTMYYSPSTNKFHKGNRLFKADDLEWLEELPAPSTESGWEEEADKIINEIVSQWGNAAHEGIPRFRRLIYDFAIQFQLNNKQ